jgi:hypothetical protein
MTTNTSNACGEPNIQIIVEDDTVPQCNHCRSRRLRRVSPALFTLATSSKFIAFPRSNELLCNTSSATGEEVHTMEGYKTCVLSFARPVFEADYINNIEKRYTTVYLGSDDIDAEVYSLNIWTQNIEGNLRTMVYFELDGVVQKLAILDDKTWGTFTMILHEKDVTILMDDVNWYTQLRNAFSGNKIYRGRFNLNHENTHVQNIAFSYFKDAKMPSDYIVSVLPIQSNTYRINHVDNAIYYLKDVDAENGTASSITSTWELHVETIPSSTIDLSGSWTGGTNPWIINNEISGFEIDKNTSQTVPSFLVVIPQNNLRQSGVWTEITNGYRFVMDTPLSYYDSDSGYTQNEQTVKYISILTNTTPYQTIVLGLRTVLGGITTDSEISAQNKRPFTPSNPFNTTTPLTLYVQNMNYDLQDSYVPKIKTFIDRKNIKNNNVPAYLSRNAYVQNVYLSSDETIGYSYTPVFTKSKNDLQTTLLSGKMVSQELSYFNMDSSGTLLSDVQVYM